MGTLMGKRYDLRKYINVVMIVSGVALFMGGGDKHKAGGDDDKTSSSQLIGILLLFISLCFDGGTGAYEDKLMSVHSVQPFDLMYNIQLGKTILAGVSLLVSFSLCLNFNLTAIVLHVLYFLKCGLSTSPSLTGPQPATHFHSNVPRDGIIAHCTRTDWCIGTGMLHI